MVQRERTIFAVEFRTIDVQSKNQSDLVPQETETGFAQSDDSDKTEFCST